MTVTTNHPALVQAQPQIALEYVAATFQHPHRYFEGGIAAVAVPKGSGFAFCLKVLKASLAERYPTLVTGYRDGEPILKWKLESWETVSQQEAEEIWAGMVPAPCDCF